MVLMGIAIRHETRQPAMKGASATCLEFYRKTLELRRRQLAISIDLWFGMAAFVALLVHPLPGIAWYFFVMLGSLLALLFAVRFQGTRKASQEIEALDKLLAAD